MAHNTLLNNNNSIGLDTIIQLQSNPLVKDVNIARLLAKCIASVASSAKNAAVAQEFVNLLDMKATMYSHRVKNDR